MEKKNKLKESKSKLENKKKSCFSYKRKKCEKVKRERCDLAHAENPFAKHFYSFCKKEIEKEEMKR